jgi:deoxyribonuclease V
MDSSILHNFNVTTHQAREIQLKLAGMVCRQNHIGQPRLIAGVDISVNRVKKEAVAAVVVLSYPELKIEEVSVFMGWPEFPYVPGLLTFREAPLILEAYNKLKMTPELVFVDGQGIAHPRRIGIASHLGLLLDRPTIGCAKSRLIGEFEPPGDSAGSFSDLKDGDEVIGAVLRTRAGVKPLFVSIGHNIDLPNAVKWVLACCRGYRLTEPARFAHMAAGGNLKALS